jgi:hypothetical protein
MAAVPFFRAQHVLWKNTGKFVTSHIPAVLASLSDVAGRDRPTDKLNFTQQQWETVRSECVGGCACPIAL